MTDGDITIISGGRQLSGWTDVRVSRGVERCPSDFDISMTELYPGQATSFVVQAGDACQVQIGNDLTITGYVDKYIPGISGNEHTIRITGRNKCCDLVDCSAEWSGNQITGTSALNIAQKLAEPYGITVSGLAGVAPPQFNFMIGETPMDIIERVCRNAGLLAYDQPDGSLLLAQLGSVSAASGFTEGQNVQAAEMTYSVDQRFSEYSVYLMAMDVLTDAGYGGNRLASVTDPNVSRHRMKAIIAETSTGLGISIAKQRGTWECARRAGRSRELQVKADGWRDSAGTLWTPNTLVPLVFPSLKLPKATYVIGEVTYRRSEKDGTTADLVLMPQDAYLPEPIVLQPQFVDVPGSPAIGVR